MGNELNASVNMNLAVSLSVLAPAISQEEPSLFGGWLVSRRLLVERALMRTGFSLCLLQGLFDF